MKLIPLTKGYFAKVDDEDFEWLSQFKWNSMPGRKENDVRAVRRVTLVGQNKRKTVYLHREILGNHVGFVDHTNGDTLDNRKSNLRICTVALNNRNKLKYANNRSGYKGVSPHFGKWPAQIRVGGKRIHLGTFVSVEDAAKAYNTASKKNITANLRGQMESNKLNSWAPGDIEKLAHQLALDAGYGSNSHEKHKAFEAGAIAAFQKAAEMIEACPTVFNYERNDYWCEYKHHNGLDTHRAKLVGVKPIEEKT